MGTTFVTGRPPNANDCPMKFILQKRLRAEVVCKGKLLDCL
ncbi:MAG: hypothetical protein PUG65_03640 [Firmicutes bacterium]|nr:hypothetical protein [Bacillota bacterium]